MNANEGSSSRRRDLCDWGLSRRTCMLDATQGHPGVEGQIAAWPLNPTGLADTGKRLLMHLRTYFIALLAALVVFGHALAEEATFTPLSMPQGNTEDRTGMWFCPDLG